MKKRWQGKKWSWVGVSAALLAIGLAAGWGAGMTMANTAAEPGTQDDPLVTKSYVEERLAQLGGSGGSMGDGGAADALVIVELQPGQRLIGEAGTEITVRSGYARVMGKNNQDKDLGLNNVTAGSRLLDGNPVPQEHLLTVPRSDGRGIVAETRSGNLVTVMVRGGYAVR